MYSLIIKPLAELDATKAVNWYNNKKVGLGEEFLLVLDAVIHAIERNPKQYQIVYKNIRRAFIQRFPYGIFFVVEENVIYVLAIQHTSRNPKIWKNR